MPSDETVDVFIWCHPDDATWTRYLGDNLRLYAIKPFLESDLIPGDLRVLKVEEALRRASAAVVVVGRDVNDDRAADYAGIVEYTASTGLRLIPVLHRNRSVPPLLAGRKHIDFSGATDRESYELALRSLAAAAEGAQLEAPAQLSGTLTMPPQATLVDTGVDRPALNLGALRKKVLDETRAQLDLLLDKDEFLVPWRVRGDATKNAGHAGNGEGTVPARIFGLVDAGINRLLILGGAGSGKSMVGLELIRDYLTSGKASEMVPIPFSISSWNPHVMNIHDWMVNELIDNYGKLGSAAELSQATMDGRIFPILDGFDEIPQGAQASAARHLGMALRGPVVLLTREEGVAAYPRFATTVMPGHTVVEMEPVTTEEIARYLRRRGLDPDSLIMKSLGRGEATPVSDALSTPLMLWLACSVYAPLAPDAEEMSVLLDKYRFPDRATIERHLLSELVPSVFARSSLAPLERPADYRYAKEADRWLRYIAQKINDERRFGFWTFITMAPTRTLALTAGAFAGVLIGFLSSVDAVIALGLLAALPLGVLVGFAFATAYGLTRAGGSNPARIGYGSRELDFKATMNLPKLRLGLLSAAFSVAAAGATVLIADAAGAGITPSSPAVAWWVLILLLAAAACTSVMAALAGLLVAKFLQRARAIDKFTGASAPTPDVAARADSKATVVISALAFVLNGILIGGVLSVAGHRPLLLQGLLCGAGSTIGTAMVFTFWAPYRVTHAWLALRGRLPWRLMRFLRDARRNGVLRHNAIAYEFRHVELQRSLAGPIYLEEIP